MNPCLPLLILAFRPFLEPLNLHEYWLWLMPPLVVAVTLAYKAMKVEDLSKLMGETIRLSVYILVLMVGSAAALWAIVEAVERV
jgi:hypothetical protein